MSFLQTGVLTHIVLTTLCSPHVRGPGVSVHLDVETARITHGGPGAVPPPQAGAGRVAVAAPRVGPYQQLAARVLGNTDKLEEFYETATLFFRTKVLLA